MPSGDLRSSVRLRLLRCRFWKSGPWRGPPSPSPGAGRRLDLDDLGAPIGELAHRGRTGAHAGQVEHLEAGKRRCGGLSGMRLSIRVGECKVGEILRPGLSASESGGAAGRRTKKNRRAVRGGVEGAGALGPGNLSS